MGQLSSEDQYYLAENFMAIFNRDYRRIAELHVQAGWMPSHIRIDELEAAARSVCEPYFTRPLSEISLAEVLVKLFRTAQRYELTLQPQLILLQKTLLNIEGVGRLLDPQHRHLGGGAAGARTHPGRTLQPAAPGRRVPQAPAGDDHPRAGHAAPAACVADPAGRRPARTRAALARTWPSWCRRSKSVQRRTVSAIFGTGLLIVAAVLYGLEAGGPRIFSVPAAAWIAGLGGLWALLAAWPRR